MSTTTLTPPPLNDATRLWRERIANPEPIPASEFDPPPHIAEKILSDLDNQTITFSEVADKAHTTIQSLTQWLIRPDIAAQQDAAESQLRRRVRLHILHNATTIVDTCATIMQRYTRAPDRGPDNHQDPRTHAIQTRNASNALMAARVMLHLSRFLEGPAGGRPPRTRRAHSPNQPDPRLQS